MNKTAITTKNAPKAIGAYNQGIISGNIVFVSGQLPLKPDGELIDDDPHNQTIQCLRNIEAIINEAGGNKTSIVKLTIFLKNLKAFPSVNEAFEEFFKGTDFPARSTIEVSALPKNSDMEIEAIAVL